MKKVSPEFETLFEKRFRNEQVYYDETSESAAFG